MSLLDSPPVVTLSDEQLDTLADRIAARGRLRFDLDTALAAFTSDQPTPAVRRSPRRRHTPATVGSILGVRT